MNKLTSYVKEICTVLVKLFFELIRLIIYLILRIPIYITSCVQVILSLIPASILAIYIVFPVKLVDNIFNTEFEKRFNDSNFAKLIEKYYLFLDKKVFAVDVNYDHAVCRKFYNLKIWNNLDPENNEKMQFENLAGHTEIIIITFFTAMIYMGVLATIVVILVFIFSPNYNL